MRQRRRQRTRLAPPGPQPPPSASGSPATKVPRPPPPSLVTGPPKHRDCRRRCFSLATHPVRWGRCPTLNGPPQYLAGRMWCEVRLAELLASEPSAARLPSSRCPMGRSSRHCAWGLRFRPAPGAQGSRPVVPGGGARPWRLEPGPRLAGEGQPSPRVRSPAEGAAPARATTRCRRQARPSHRRQARPGCSDPHAPWPLWSTRGRQ